MPAAPATRNPAHEASAKPDRYLEHLSRRPPFSFDRFVALRIGFLVRHSPLRARGVERQSCPDHHQESLYYAQRPGGAP